MMGTRRSGSSPGTTSPSQSLPHTRATPGRLSCKFSFWAASSLVFPAAAAAAAAAVAAIAREMWRSQPPPSCSWSSGARIKATHHRGRRQSSRLPPRPTQPSSCPTPPPCQRHQQRADPGQQETPGGCIPRRCTAPSSKRRREDLTHPRRAVLIGMGGHVVEGPIRKQETPFLRTVGTFDTWFHFSSERKLEPSKSTTKPPASYTVHPDTGQPSSPNAAEYLNLSTVAGVVCSHSPRETHGL
ncbi:uncharacterized protein LOC142821194 isoform X1 [Pelodiscus sinensis]|uniref:uncharacterized protein LOC142821194 isoform X1 n=1 Tax=Pelodiscus sinensis TaxID=13735 RepID=UPI003F6CCC46